MTLQYDVDGHPNKFDWTPDLEWGYLEPDFAVKTLYDDDYFQNYRDYEKSQIAHELMRFRCDWVRKFTITEPENIVDIGCGSGHFVRTMGCKGFDVMDRSIALLNRMKRFHDIYDRKTTVATFWDSIEHIIDPTELLNNVNEWVFASVPVYEPDPEKIMQSKHFKPNEHIWYWTGAGFVRYMDQFGFEFVDACDGESKIGREDIQTFAFRRK